MNAKSKVALFTGGVDRVGRAITLALQSRKKEWKEGER
jgi:NAD(P)-dependent dehydrogenase (short-subunit alcohol dehydrogenase family)